MSALSLSTAVCLTESFVVDLAKISSASFSSYNSLRNIDWTIQLFSVDFFQSHNEPIVNNHARCSPRRRIFSFQNFPLALLVQPFGLLKLFCPCNCAVVKLSKSREI
eukprot:sb/3477694/